jgi:hypothetical protein
MDQKTLNDFVGLVAKMRHLQKEYFRTKRGDVLVSACAAEGEVDKFIDNYQQLKLF